MPQKIRQIKNNLRRKIHDNLHKDSRRNTFEADQYFNPPVILIGNKSDGDESKRQVDQKTAEAKAQELGNFTLKYHFPTHEQKKPFGDSDVRDIVMTVAQGWSNLFNILGKNQRWRSGMAGLFEELPLLHL